MSKKEVIYENKIDFHAHYLPNGYVNALERHFKTDPDGFPTPSWSIERSLRQMEYFNIRYSILSLSSPHINFGDKSETLELAEEINEVGFDLKSRYPDKLNFFATLPIPYISESINMVKKAIIKQKAFGFTLPSNAKGVYLGDPILDQIMAELDKHHAIVTIHPNEPSAHPENITPNLGIPYMEFFFDTTRAVLNMLERGVFYRYQNIQWIIPHSGALLPILADRVRYAYLRIAKRNENIPERYMDIYRLMKDWYFDTAGYILPRLLPDLLELADSTHILYGSDLPYTSDERSFYQMKQLEDTSLITKEIKKMILNTNGEQLLKFNAS